MASDLISVSDCETLVQSGLPSDQLEAIIDSCDAEIIKWFGVHDGEQTLRLNVGYSRPTFVVLPRPAASVESVKHWFNHQVETDDEDTDQAQAVVNWYLSGDGREIRRRVGFFLENVAVTYTPVAENPLRRSVLVDLVKEQIASDGLMMQRVGSTSSTRLSEVARMRILNRLRHNYGGAGLLA